MPVLFSPWTSSEAGQSRNVYLEYDSAWHRPADWATFDWPRLESPFQWWQHQHNQESFQTRQLSRDWNRMHQVYQNDLNPDHEFPKPSNNFARSAVFPLQCIMSRCLNIAIFLKGGGFPVWEELMIFCNLFFWQWCWDLSYLCENSALLRNLMSKQRRRQSEMIWMMGRRFFAVRGRIMECALECSDVWSSDIIPLHASHCTPCSKLHSGKDTADYTDPLTSSPCMLHFA